MKKFLSVLLVMGMLVSIMIPAAVVSASSGVPELVVNETTEFMECTSSAEVTISLANNPGINEMRVYVWYMNAEGAIVANEDDEGSELSFANTLFDGASLSVNKSSTISATKNALKAAGITASSAMKVAIIDFATEDGTNAIGDGAIATLTYQIAGDAAIGDSYTYGAVVGYAYNEDGDDVEFETLGYTGAITCVDDPYLNETDTPTVIGVPVTVQPDQKTVDIPFKFDANPGVNFFKIVLGYDSDELSVLSSKNGNIFKDSEYHPGLANDDPNKVVIKTAFDYFDYSIEGKYAYVMYYLCEDPAENNEAIGTVGTVTFDLPDNMTPGAQYNILVCYSDGDIGQVHGTGDDTTFIDIHPQVVDCVITVAGEAACTHPTTTVDITEPTCTIDGSRKTYCTVCNELIFDEVLPATGHSGGEEVVVAPTCTIDGTTTVKCTSCGEVLYKGTIPATGHTAGEWTQTTAPTCTEAGEETQYCTVCDAVLETRPVAATEHKAGEAVVVEPTCTVDGSSKTYCTVCNELISDEVLPATGHTAGEWTQTTAPTCTAAGEVTQYCTVCDAVLETRPVAAIGHTAGEWTQTTAPTCTEAGEETQYCTVCDAVLETRPVAATGHKAGEAVVVEPTCTVDGSSKTYCTVCNELISDVVLAATGHSAGEWTQTTAPTCTEAGEETQYCTVCDAVLETRPVAATGHKAGEWTVITPATYAADGVEAQYCTVCNEKLNERAIPRLTVNVTVKYVDESGNSIADEVTVNGLYTGNPYTASAVAVSGYTALEQSKTIDALAESGNVITFVYADNSQMEFITGTVKGWGAESVTVDEVNAEIHVTGIKNYAKASFGLKVPEGATSYADITKVNFVTNGINYFGSTTDTASSYELTVTLANGASKTYTVYVEFTADHTLDILKGWSCSTATVTAGTEGGTIDIVSGKNVVTVTFAPSMLNVSASGISLNYADGQSVAVIMNGTTKYFAVDATRGANQVLTLTVTTADGSVLTYTVNVTFDSDFVTSVAAGYTCENVAFDGNDIISVSAKEGVSTVAYKLNLPYKATVEVVEGNAEIVNSAGTYLRSNAADGSEQTYKIKVTLANGLSKIITVNVAF